MVRGSIKTESYLMSTTSDVVVTRLCEDAGKSYVHSLANARSFDFKVVSVNVF